MNHEEPGTSSDLMRWLKMLTLPLGVQGALAAIMVAGVLSAPGRWVQRVAARGLPGLPGAAAVLRARSGFFRKGLA